MRTRRSPVLASLGIALIVLSLIAAGCTSASPFPDDAANFYESLDLESPTRAVETFSDAFARKDFMTVWLTLDKRAQFEFESSFNLLQYSHLIDMDAVPDMQAEIVAAYSYENRETTDRWYLFDRLMMIADRHDAYLIDLSGRVTPGDESMVGEDVEVLGVVEGIRGEVRFRLVESPSGRWRVYQVVVPGGDESAIPWSVPSG